MRVAHARVGDEDPGFLQHPIGKLLRAQRVELLLGAIRRRSQRELRQPRKHRLCGPRPRLDLGISIDDHFADETQKPRRPVTLAGASEQLRRLIDELGGVIGGCESRMHDQLIEEPQVGDDAADSKLPQGTMHPRDGLLRGRRPGRHLDQQRIIKARDDGSRIGGAGIETNAESRGAAVGRDAAIVRHEIVLRVLRRDAALQRMGVDANIFLLRHPALRGPDPRTGGDADLRLDQIDPGHAFGDGVLDLNARIDFDEIEFAGVGILQKFDRAGGAIGDRAADFERRLAQIAPLHVG